MKLPITLTAFLALASALSAADLKHVQQRISTGVIEGVVSADGKVRTFKGIPYAAPPTGALRWKAPEPVKPWSGVLDTTDFGPRPMQAPTFYDMVFHDRGASEDCLYLNLWIPEEHRGQDKLPVMVWIFGGGFVAGSTSEARQDGGNLCKKGVIVVSMNYRLGVLGFLAHPELTQESPHGASGNYGLMDQIAALQWVRENIAAFGGDPGNVTIFGESAGSFAVSALMAAPGAQGLFHKAIGQSGAFFGSTLPARDLAQGEQMGLEFARDTVGAASLAELRAKPAQEILDAALREPRRWFSPVVDGHVLPEAPAEIYRAGRQAHIPLLAGWTRDEGSAQMFLGDREPTVANYEAKARERFGEHAPAFLEVYPARNADEVKRAAADLAGDDFIGYSTWRWLEHHRQTGDAATYRYRFDQTLPLAADAKPDAVPVAPHAADIEFVFQMLGARPLPWRDEDHRLAELMATYWTNFAKTGNPNGPQLPKWPAYEEREGFPVMHLQATPAARPDELRGRYQFLDRAPGKKA